MNDLLHPASFHLSRRPRRAVAHLATAIAVVVALGGCKEPDARDHEKPATRSPRAPAVSQPIALISAAEAGDDSVATLAMFLRLHSIKPSFGDIHAALYPEGVEKPSGLEMAHAAEHFGVRLRGVQFETEEALRSTTRPYIAHVTTTKGPFPRPLGRGDLDGNFVIVEHTDHDAMTIVDPVLGARRHVTIKTFMETASGVALLFVSAKATPAP